MPTFTPRRLMRGARRRLRARFSGSVADEASGPSAGLLAGDKPTYAYIVLEPSTDTLLTVVQAVQSQMRQTSSHVPLLVTTSRDFLVISHAGIAFEYLPDRQTWETQSSDLSWEDLISARVQEIYQVYRPTRIMLIEQGGGLDIGRLVSLLAADHRALANG